MEINEQGNYELNRESEQDKFAELKEQITADVRNEIASLGAEIIPAGYEGTKEVAKLVDKASGLKAQYEAERDRITQRYSKEVAESKLKVLEQDHKLDMQDLIGDLDKIVDKDNKCRLEAIRELQNSDQYKADRKEALEMLALLKGANCDIPLEMFTDFISPLISAKDTKTLEIVKLLAGKDTVNAGLVDRAIVDINNYMANTELTNFIGSAKAFLSTGEAELTLRLYMQAYGRK